MANDTAATAEDRAEGSAAPAHTRAAAPPGEWLFQREGQVFGPISGQKLLELLIEGAIGAATRVAPEGRPWRSLRELPELLVELRKLEARARVRAELDAARGRVRRRNVLRWAALVLAVAALVVLVSAVASYLAVERPWQSRSKLLDDFGDAITVGAVHVGSSRVPADEEIAVPTDAAVGAGRGAARPRRLATAGQPAQVPSRSKAGANAAATGGLVLTQYDPVRIQQTVARSKGSLAVCLRDEAQRSPELVGEIPVEFAIANDGTVAALWIGDPRFKSGELHRCLLEKLRQWSFDPFPGQRPIVSLSFRMGGR